MEEQNKAFQPESGRNIDGIYARIEVSTIAMYFGYGLLPLVDEAFGSGFMPGMQELRKNIADDTGFVFPAVRLRDSLLLEEDEYSIEIKGVTVARDRVLPGKLLALFVGQQPEEVDLKGEDAQEPAYGVPGRWIDPAQAEQATKAGLTLVEPTTVMLTHLNNVLRDNLHELLTVEETSHAVELFAQRCPATVRLMGECGIGPLEVQKTLAGLLREDVPVHDLETIFAALCDCARDIQDPDLRCEHVRQALRRVITAKYAQDGLLRLITLDNAIEDMILEGITQTDTGGNLNLDADKIQALVLATKAQVEEVQNRGVNPLLVATPVVRIYYKKLLDQFFCDPFVPVISYNEIDRSAAIEVAATVRLEAPPKQKA